MFRLLLLCRTLAFASGAIGFIGQNPLKDPVEIAAVVNEVNDVETIGRLAQDNEMAAFANVAKPFRLRIAVHQRFARPGVRRVTRRECVDPSNQSVAIDRRLRTAKLSDRPTCNLT